MQNLQKRFSANVLLFWLSAVALLFFRLGTSAAWQSEDRWLEIVREMLLSGHWFRPTLNSQLYFDKPLLSYWLIIVVQYATGALNEWSLRIPSAIAGLIALWATIDLGKQLKDNELGRSAGWILLTCFGFLQWARLGEADMENLAATILAINWYWRHRASTRIFDYLILYVIMAIGAQCKGLTAIVIPVIAILADRTQPKRVHININHVIAAVLGAGIYFLPFLLAPEGTHAQSTATAPSSGLAQVLRENVVRYFAPFDHTEPFYTYFIALPQYLFPWSVVFLCALYWAVRDKLCASNARSWLLLTFALLFVFFTLSGSRRNYYILPLLPYCALLIAFYLRGATAKNVLRITLAMLSILAVILLAVWPLWPQLQQHAQNALPAILRWHLFAIGLAMITAAASQFFIAAPADIRLRNACLLAACIFFGGFFFRVQLALDSFRSEAAFARDLGRIQREHPAAAIATYREKPGGELMFYAQLPPTVQVLLNREELNDFLATPQSKLLVVYHRYDSDMPESLQTTAPILEETRFPWEKNNREKNRAWLLQ